MSDVRGKTKRTYQAGRYGSLLNGNQVRLIPQPTEFITGRRYVMQTAALAFINKGKASHG